MKKLLALVLAMVMTLGLATVGTGAAYSDAADIDYTEAVDVMTAIEVFDGMDGAFNPDGNLTREQGAKIISYMILGKKNADSLSTAAAPFTDVAADRWSAGSIAYASSEGIISGVGDGKFDPTGTLTGYAFAKMCLVALGYNAEYEKFVNTGDWTINVGKAAASAGLNDNLNIVMSQPISRQEACQMALNTLKGTLVDYDKPINVKGGDGMEVTVGAERKDVTIGTAGDSKYDYTGGTNDGYVQFVERYYRNPDLTLNDDETDDFGRPANEWKLGVATIGDYGKKATVTYTAGVKGGKVYTDLGGSSIDFINGMMVDANNVDTTKLSVTLDGTDLVASGAVGIASTYTATLDTIITRGNTTNDLPNTGNGILTEVYYDKNDNTLSIVQVTTFLAQAQSDYSATTKKVVIRVDDATHATITTLSSEDFPVVEGAKKDDYFYITASGTTNDDVATVVKVPANAFVPGVTVSAFKTGTNVTAGGTTYSLAAQGTASLSYGVKGIIDNWSLQSSKYDLILDPYGYVLAADTNDSDTEITSNYLFVKDVSTSGFQVLAKVVKMDGTSETVTINKVNDNDAGASTYIVEANTEGGTMYGSGTAAAFTGNAISAGGFYTYKSTSSGYNLTYVNSYVASLTVAPKADMFTPYTANSKTVLVQDEDVTIGVANFVKKSGADTAVYYCGDDTGVIFAAYTAQEAGSSSSSKYIYVFNGLTSAQDSADSDEYYKRDAFVDGEKVTINTSDSSYASGGVFKVSTNSKGQYVLSASTYVDNYAVANTIGAAPANISYSNGNVTIQALGGEAKTYVVSSDVEVNYIDCYSTGDSVRYTTADVISSFTGNYRVALIQASSSDEKIAKIYIVSNRGAAGSDF